MNSGLELDQTIIGYYDSDYPSRSLGAYPENFDEVTGYQGVRDDVERYLEIARESGAERVLELGCGTGRVAIPLAREGLVVTGVDLSPAMLERFDHRLASESPETADRISLVCQDVSALELEGACFDLAVFPFNGLLCLPDFEQQRRAVERIGSHVKAGGLCVVDAVNPVPMGTAGSDTPRPFFTRRHPDTGLPYTRFAMRGPIDAEQRQRLHGWYDQEDERGVITRKRYSMHWRPIYRFELQLMLERAGFEIVRVEGGHRGQAFEAHSPHIFITARRVG